MATAIAERQAFSQRLTLSRLADAEEGNSPIAVFEGILTATGRVRDALGGQGRWDFTADALRDAVDKGRFRALACFIDHAGFFDGPSMRDLLGAWHNVVFDEASQAVRGELHAYVTDSTRGVIQALDAISADKDTGHTPPDVGVSIVCIPDYEEVRENNKSYYRITALRAVESADVVFQPAVPTARLKFQGDHPMTDPIQEGQAGTLEAVATPPSPITNNLVFTMPVQAPAQPEPDQTEIALSIDNVNALDDLATQLQARLAQADQVIASANQWRTAFSGQIATAMINASGLPQASQRRLAATAYNTADEVQHAIETERAMVEELADQLRGQFIQTGHRPVTAGDMNTEEDRVRNAVQWMFGVQGAQMPDSMEMRRLDWLWVAVTGDDQFNGVYNPDKRKFTMLTALTLPNLALDAMNKIIVARIAELEHYRWYEDVVSVVPNNGTLMDMKYISYGGISNLPTVGDTAAYTELGLTDAKETSSFVKKGGYVPLSRTIIKNSDLLRLQAVPKALAAAAIRTRAAAVAALFTQNSGVGPTMNTDSKALFHTDHGNLATTAFGTDDAAWIAARKECYKHQEMGTDARLGMYPKIALLPVDLYETALKVFGYGTGNPTAREVLTESRGRMDPRPVPIVVPEWTDATDWAYLVDPAIWPVLHMSYSGNPSGGSHPAPELFIANDPNSGLLFSNDVLPIKVRDEWTLGVSTPTGIGKRNVAG